MRLKITTSIRNMEAANCILRIGLEALQKDEALMKSNGLENIHVYEAMLFRAALLKAAVRTTKEKAKRNNR